MVRLVSLVVALTALAGPARARADGRATDDHRGFFATTGPVFGVELEHSDPLLGADAAVGWGVTPRLAVLARTSASVAIESGGWIDLTAAARIWHGRLFVQPHLGLVLVSEVYDCGGSPPEPECWGGSTVGLATGAEVGGDLLRGRHFGFALSLGVNHRRWDDASNGEPNDLTVVRLGFGLTIR